VVAIITKLDGLITKLFGKLRDQDVPAREAREQSKTLAIDHFHKKLVPQLKTAEHPPAEFAYAQSKDADFIHISFRLPGLRTRNHILLDMHKLQTDCKDIVKKIANVFTDQALQILFVSTQRANAKLSTEYAIN